MLILLSPSKTQDFSDDLSCSEFTRPEMLNETKVLASILQKCSAKKLEKTLNISTKLATLNHERYQSFSTPFTQKNARQALLAFRGDVYQGFDLASYKKADFNFAQKHLRILSGLYGALRPLDLIQPYRLEMKTALKTDKGSSLYDFWGDKISQQLQSALPSKGERHIINLASNEYSKAALLKTIDAQVTTPVFKEKKGDDFKVVALFAKRARGSMTNWIIQNRLKRPADLQAFREGGYRFRKALSDNNTLVFVR